MEVANHLNVERLRFGAAQKRDLTGILGDGFGVVPEEIII